MLKNSVLIFLAKNNYNEREYLQTRRILEKAGIMIFIASDTVGVCTGHRGLKVIAEIGLYNIHEKNFCAIVLIGGGGIREYWNNYELHNCLKKFDDNNKVIASICSAPVILARAGMLNGLNATCFYKDVDELLTSGANYKSSPIVVSKNIITSSSEESSSEFGRAVVRKILSN